MPLNFYRPIIYCFNHKKSNSTFPNLITREAYLTSFNRYCQGSSINYALVQ